MLTYLVAFFLSMCCAFALTPGVRAAAHRHGLLDPGTEARKVHARPIPRVGGVAIAAAYFLPVLALLFWDNRVSNYYYADAGRFVALGGGAAAMVLLGLYDDVRGASPRVKLAVQILVATAAFALGYRILQIGNPLGAPISLGWLAYPITVLWIVGIVNAMNLIDGLDGLATGIALFTLSVLFLLGVVNNNPVVGLTSAALMGALVGFLPYNFNPASIFMGDSGSLFLGYVLAVTAISGSSKSSTVVSLLIPLLALGLPVMDTLLAVIRRFLAGRHVFAADRGHVHHRLLDRGLTHRQAVLVLYVGCAFLALGALALVFANSLVSAVVLVIMAVGTLMFSRALGFLSWSEIRHSVRYGLQRQATLRERLATIAKAASAVRTASTIPDALDALRAAAPHLQIDQVHVRAQVSRGGEVRVYETRTPDGDVPSSGHFFQLAFPLTWRADDVDLEGFVRFGWDCDEERLLLPEAASYDWLALVLRDRVAVLSSDAEARHFRPGIARPGEG